MPQRKIEKLYQETGILGRQNQNISSSNFLFRPWHLQTEVCNLISITLLMFELRFVLHDSNFYYQIIIGHFFWVFAGHTEMDF